MKSDYLSIADFAKKAGVSKQAVYKRVDKDLQPYVKVVEGKKSIHTSALTAFNTTASSQVVEQLESTEPKNEFIRQLKLENERLNNQLVETIGMLKRENEENKKLTDQLVNLSNDFAELAKQSNLLASQAQSLQGHIQQQALEKSNDNHVSTVESQVDIIDENFNRSDEPTKKRGFLAKLFG